MLTIHGRTNSSNVQKVLWALRELDVPFERRDAGGAFGVVDTPEYKAMNPNSRVPTMEEDGFVLWESNAIVRYLAGRHGAGTFCPEDPQVRADADRWMDWQQTTVAPQITPVFWNLVRTPEPDRDPAAIEAGRLGMIPLMQIMDSHLSGRGFMVGDRLTMADIPLGVMTYRWLTLIDDRPAMANLEGWYARICERPAFRTTVLDIPLT